MRELNSVTTMIRFGASTSVLLLAMAGSALANPNTAPDFKEVLAQELGMPENRLSALDLTDETLNRDGLSADYFTQFSVQAAAPISSYAEIDRGSGYVVVQKIVDQGDPLTVTGSVLGAYTGGSWQVEVHITEVQNPGGKPLAHFQSEDVVVLMSDTADLDSFVAARKKARKLSHELELQNIEQAAAEEALRRQIAAEKARVEAEEIEKAASESRSRQEVREARMISERAEADRILMSLFEDGATFPAQISHAGERVGGEFKVSKINDNVIDLAGTFDRGAQGSYQTTVVIKLSPKTGVLHLTMAQVNDWQGSRYTKEAQAELNTEGGFIRFVIGGNGFEPFDDKGTELIIEGLDLPAEAG